MTRPSSTDVSRTARAEASAWVARLHGPGRSAEMEAGFRRWLAERPENAEEFEGLTEVWDLLAAGDAVRAAPRLAQWERSAEARAPGASRAGRASPPRTRRAFAALAACAVLALAAVGAWRAWPHPAYATAVGEQRVVRLDDGSRLWLNSDSRVAVDFSAAERRVRLSRGEVLFEVHRDAGRRFVVEADGHRVTALGTSFVVRREDERMSVTLIEGKVAVAARRTGAAAPAAEILAPGQRLVLTATAPPRIDTPRLEAVTAWRRGEVLLDDTPLAEAVAEMNRYDGTTIVIDGAEAGALSVSGLYHTGDNAGFASSVARMYGLEMVERDGRIHLKK